MFSSIFRIFFILFCVLFSSFSFGQEAEISISKVIKKKESIEIFFEKKEQGKVIKNDSAINNEIKQAQVLKEDDKKLQLDQGGNKDLKNKTNHSLDKKQIAQGDKDNKESRSKSIFDFLFKKKNFINKNIIARLDHTETLFLKSNFNSVEYKISVSLPTDYEISDKKYPVIYILDGHYSFAISHGLVRYLNDKGFEKFILVGIGYNEGGFQTEQERIEFFKFNRTRDYTPVKSTAGTHVVKYQNISGKAQDFQRFINEQLIPFINKKYKTDTQNNTLAGHSYGGLFTMWNYITENKNFKNFIAISPSCWYENMWIVNLAKNKKKLSNSRIYFSVGGRETNSMIFTTKELLKEFRKIEQSRSKIRFETIKDENHDTLFSSSFIHAISFIFKGST